MNNPAQPHIPKGYARNSAGHLVPVETIDEIDLARSDLVTEIIAKAQTLQQQIRDFKLATMGDIEAFIELSAERYQVRIGGSKGNVTLTSYDGKFKIQRAISEHLVFDERLQVAKELIDQCIHRWSSGSGEEIKALVEHAFQVDKEGRISTSRVLELRRLKIDDEQWQRAMAAIADSIQVTGSKTYLRIYERVGDCNQWKPISLDIAAL